MIKNPFCFIAQVLTLLLPAQPLYLGEGFARSPSCQANDVDFEHPARADFCLINDLIMTSINVSAPALSTVTSHHGDSMPYIRSFPSPVATSGLGSSTSGTQLKNPFCFIAQVLTLLLPAQPLYLGEGFARSPSCQANDVGFEHPARADFCLINDLIMTSINVSAPALSTVTSHHGDSMPYIRSFPSPVATSGLGSSTSGTQLKNPFCFIAQLRQQPYICAPPSRTSRRIGHPLKVSRQRARTTTFSQSFFLRTASDWNDLPHEIVAITCPSTFLVIQVLLVPWLSAVVSDCSSFTPLSMTVPWIGRPDEMSAASTCCAVDYDGPAIVQLVYCPTAQWTTASITGDDLSSRLASVSFSGHGSSAFGTAPNRQTFAMQETRFGVTAT
ncbi:uncharacterized protein [Dermacentor albipictus]|uniref:uncharacterized protein isoform X2 n=1 Tax=Dermacentor albipictus TaxID=60249 RepID=UPI0031FBD646